MCNKTNKNQKGNTMDFVEIAKPGHLGYSEDIIQESNTLLNENDGYIVIDEVNDGYIIYSEKPESEKPEKDTKSVKHGKKAKRTPLKELFKLQLYMEGLGDHAEYIIMGKLAYPIVGKEADKLLVRVETLLSHQKAKENFKKVQNTKQAKIQSTKLRAW